MAADRIGDVLGVAHLDGSGVRTAVSRLRRVVGGRLQTSTAGYRLVPAEGEFDSADFDAALRTPAAESPSERVDRLRGALALWRGDAYAEFVGEDWATAPATRLEQARLGVLEDLAEAMMSAGAIADAVPLLQANAAALRYRERTAALLMEALAASGRVVDALRVYQEFRRELVDDIGIEPTESLRRLESELLVNDGVVTGRSTNGSAPTPSAGNLVEPPTSFIGRVHELHDVVVDLQTSRLVSLVGPGGVGKTRLAVAVACSIASSYPDGVWFVDLAPLSDDDAVAHRAASALGAPSAPDAHLVGSIVEHMRERQALVVVDNCEQVLAGASSVVAPLITECPRLRVIVTSRQSLALPGERVHPLAPLGQDDGVELFKARAVDAGRRSEFAAIDEAAIAEICLRVEGMPLSIELAARRVRSATPAEIVERLDVALHDTGVGQGPQDRQRSTRSVVEWSYRLLSEPQRALFDRLSVFAGRFDRAAATAVCEFDPIPTGTASELLELLVEKSMVIAEVHGGSARFRLLDTMRQFGHDQLVRGEGRRRPADEHAVLIARHRDHCRSTAAEVDRLFPDDVPAANALLDDQWDNWRVAISRALESRDPLALSDAADIVWALSPATMVTFHTEIASWVSAVRERLPDDHRMAPLVQFADAQWSMVLGNLGRAIELATRGVELGGPFSSLFWYVIADSQTLSGNAAAGLAAASESLICSEGVPWEGLLIGTACRCASAQEPSLVRPWAERLCAVAAANGRADDRARAAYAMGLASLVDDDARTALAWFREARDAAGGLRGLESEALQGIARATAQLGGERAEAAFLEALTALRQDRNWMYTWVVLDALTTYWATHERADDAAVLLGHLEAHVPPSSVDAASRRRAVEVVGADPRLAVLRQRGATMRANDVLQFAISGLAH